MVKCMLQLNTFRDNGVEFIETFEGQSEWPHSLDEKKIYYYDILNKPSSMTTGDTWKAINRAFTLWELEADIIFRPFTYAPTEVTEPDIRISFSSTDELFIKKPSVLAYAFYPKTSQQGKVVFNNNYVWALDAGGITVKELKKLAPELIKGTPNDDVVIKTYSLPIVSGHEFGHTSGLKHDATGNKNSKDLMDAFYDPTIVELSDRDIIRIRKRYGIRIFSRWSHYGRLKRWLKKKFS